MMDLLEECRGAGRIGISGHVRPDGDCVGAVLALRMYLQKKFPETLVTAFLEPPADIFREIKGFEEIVTDFPEEEPFDVLRWTRTPGAWAVRKNISARRRKPLTSTII